MHLGTLLLCDVGSVTFDGSHLDEQWLPYRRIKAKIVRSKCIHVGRYLIFFTTKFNAFSSRK